MRGKYTYTTSGHKLSISEELKIESQKAFEFFLVTGRKSINALVN
ncbi:MAG: hypothetical protein ACI8RA_003098 [Chlamydiales bacterium]|jgi:hypothetical protein